MTKRTQKPNESVPDIQPREDTNVYLHTEKEHKDWYNRPAMGNLGDARGYLKQDMKKKPGGIKDRPLKTNVK